ncbi:MAG: type 4b pilus protein PilO2 [Alphaproteobacteria bacterium]|nr:type 4b pilus protein PilO2 [Alphaproteobacteria bacterium]
MDEQVTTSQSLLDEIAPAHDTHGVVVIDGQKYAVGLLWQPIQRNDDPLSEIREAIESEAGADLYCWRSTVQVSQYGIGKTAYGHRDGMPSLAATVASGLANYSSYCGVFKLDEGWWFVAVRNDLILSEEDILYATEEEAMRAFTSMMAVPDWELKIVPSSWNIEGTDHTALTELVDRGHKIRLQEINAERKTKILLVFALLIIAVIVVIIFWAVQIWNRVWQQSTPIQPEKAPEYIQPIQPTPEKPQPWEKMVDTNAFIKTCWNNVYQLKSIEIPGWKLSTITCTPESITTAFTSQSNPSLYWFRFALEEYQFTSLIVDTTQGGSSASASINIPNMPMVASKPTWTVAQLQEDLTELKLATPALSGFSFAQQQLLDPPNRPDGSRPANQKVYTYFQFQVNSEYTPWEWISFFEKFTGLELLKMEFNPSNDASVQWKYEGRIYAK